MDFQNDLSQEEPFLDSRDNQPERVGGEFATPQSSVVSQLIDIKQFAVKLGCSNKHVRRLADSGRCPPPIRLGKLVRWHRDVVDSWIAANCPVVRPVRTNRRK
jgi:excisionase family DNA binding protein